MVQGGWCTYVSVNYAIIYFQTMASSALSHVWTIADLLSNIPLGLIKWNLNQNTTILLQEHQFENATS